MRPDRAYATFQRIVAAWGIPQEATIVIACSGGIDSVALAHLFRRFQERQRPDLQLALGHVQHNLRGAEGEAAERGCKELAEQLGFAWLHASVDVGAYQAQEQTSLETAARDLRRQGYQRWAAETGAWGVALAHHRDDQAETILGNVLRGTGLHGLGGMLETTTLERDQELHLLRPLLQVPKVDLEDFVGEVGATTYHDSTNDKNDHRRNRIRNELLPQLRRYNPQVIDALEALGGEAQEIEAFLDEQAQPAIAACVWGPSAMAIQREALNALPAPLVCAVLRHAWRRLTKTDSGLTRDHYKAWTRIAAASDGALYDLPGGWQIERAGTRVTIFLSSPMRQSEYPQEGTVRTTFGLEATADNMSGVWRAATQGDRIEIETGHAEVAELLRAAGIPRHIRTDYPVLVDNNEIQWIPGVRWSPKSSHTGKLTINESTPEGWLISQATQ